MAKAIPVSDIMLDENPNAFNKIKADAILFLQQKIDRFFQIINTNLITKRAVALNPQISHAI